MENNNGIKWLIRTVSYILVAALASGLTFFVCKQSDNAPASAAQSPWQDKLAEIEELVDYCFIGDPDPEVVADGAAAGMISGLGDRWSYYIPASEYEAHIEQMENAYVGIGVTVSTVEENMYEILQVEPGSGAQEAGIVPGDILYAVEGQKIADIGMDAGREMIRGQEDSQISITILRDGQELTLSVTRKRIEVEVANGKMLEGNIGLVTINNFDDRCAAETISAIEQLVEQGAEALIFDVRFNPGGYKHELVQVLDYLLPEGVLFRSVSYNGQESIDESNADCLDLPMAVLVNGDSYSAAEFFAAALREYEWAVIVGEPTVGKGYFQNTFELSDGSAVNLSTGKYFTPKGVSLAEEGGLVPDITVEVTTEMAGKIYSDVVEPADDPQIQAAVQALLAEIGK